MASPNNVMTSRPSSINMIVAANLQPLVKLCYWIGLLPKYDPNTRKFARARFHFLIIVFIFITTYFYALLAKYTIPEFTSNNMKLFIGKCRTMILNVLNVIAIISAATWNVKNFQQLFDNFNFFDRNAAAVHKVNAPKLKLVFLNFYALHVIIVLIFCWEIYHWYLEVGIILYKFIINDALQNYYATIYMMLQIWLLKSIRTRFEVLNRIVEKLWMPPMELSLNKTELDLSFRCDNVVKLQIAISDIVETFNNIFGSHILLNILQITLNILMSIEIVLNSTEELHFSNLLLLLSWTAYFTAQGVFVATMCEQVSNEGKKTITIAYKALIRYSNVASLREKLFVLAQQATARCPKFTAAGFFSVDFSMLFTFVNIITTYVIVIIQFSNP